jgi:magnesium transporter
MRDLSELTELVLPYAHRDFASLLQSLTIAEALDDIRNRGIGERVVYFYVIDSNGQLAGVMPTRRLLTGNVESRLQDIMQRQVVTLPHTATKADACELFLSCKYLALPIVDAERKVLGVVEAALLTQEVFESEHATDQRKIDALFSTIGIHLSALQQSSPLGMFKMRFPWLITTLGSGIVAAFLASLYEATLAKNLVLVFFLSLVTGLGESVSTQSVALALQRIHSRQTKSTYLKVLRQELMTAALLGLTCGVVVAVACVLWRGPNMPAAVLGVSIFLALCMSCVIGCSVPTLLHKLKLDPKIAAGPVALGITDICTLMFYYNLARWWLSGSH